MRAREGLYGSIPGLRHFGPNAGFRRRRWRSFLSHFDCGSTCTEVMAGNGWACGFFRLDFSNPLRHIELDIAAGVRQNKSFVSELGEPIE